MKGDSYMLNYTSTSFLKFLVDFLGSDAEVILYNVQKEEAVFIHNAFNPETKVGSPIPDTEKKFIQQKVYETKDSLMNYRAFSVDRRKLRSATHFFKDADGKLTDVLTINYKVDELIELRGVLNRLINGPEAVQYNGENIYESFNGSFEDLMNQSIQQVLEKFNVPPERLSHDEKMELIRSLDEKGTFLIKGSVTELSKVLNTSETSIYRYINKL